MSKKTEATSGISWGMALFITFLVLKLTHVIDWSWWWVTPPLWLPLTAVLAVIGIIAAILAIVEALKTGSAGANRNASRPGPRRRA